MKDNQMEVYSSDLSYDEKREIIRRCLNGDIAHILIKDKITLSELEILKILGELADVEIVTSYDVDKKGDIVITGQAEITETEHKRALTELIEGLKQRIAYNIPKILKSLQDGDYDAIYDILSIKNNSRLLKKSVKELRLSDPRYRMIVNKSMSSSEMESLKGLGETAKAMGMTKAQLNSYVKSYKLMPDYMTKKGIIYFLPKTIEDFKTTLANNQTV